MERVRAAAICYVANVAEVSYSLTASVEPVNVANRACSVY